MATIALSRPLPHHASLSSSIDLDSINTQGTQFPAKVPNKHIPICPPGPIPQDKPSTPPPSPPKDDESLQQSLLFPPDRYTCLDADSPAVYTIDPDDVAAALDHVSRQPLPDPSQVFPWLHGLHPHNQVQQAFFISRRRALRKTPRCLRGITIVKANGDLSVARLKGAIAPDEFMRPGLHTEFLDCDPKEGFSVRNFQIQAAKLAVTSDIIVYGDDDVTVRRLGREIAAAQLRWREKHDTQGHHLPIYNTFVCTSPFSDFEEKHPDIVAIDSSGNLTGYVVDFFHQERKEMYAMTLASEISQNVWLGPTPDPALGEADDFDILIECTDLAHLDPSSLRVLVENAVEIDQPRCFEFPSSGSILPPTWSHAEADGILETCKWIYHLAHGSRPAQAASGTSEVDEEDIEMSEATGEPRKVLIHCADGYTESTMLAIAYFSYSTGRPVPEAWVDLHTVMRRNFFAYPTDVALLTAIGPRLLRESPVCERRSLSDITELVEDQPQWMSGLDGSLPSRILDYMYLGNLGHANNPDLLRELGIRQILSVGETAMWRVGELEEWGEENVCVVRGVQDNGIDPLTEEFGRCLEFIDRGRRNGTATLVHCRVGVSRSATICIAEVMRSMGMSFPRAYCFVRARRLNVIIQPHLRFAYELLKWEELLQRAGARAADDSSRTTGPGVKRELEWGEIAREVALMNKPYAR